MPPFNVSSLPHSIESIGRSSVSNPTSTLTRAKSIAVQQLASVVAGLLPPPPTENHYVAILSEPLNSSVKKEVEGLNAAKMSDLNIARGASSVKVPERIYEVPQKPPLEVPQENFLFIRENFSGDMAAKELNSNPSLPFILYNKDGKTKVAYRDGDIIKAKTVSKEITSDDGGAVFSSKGFSKLPQSVRADLVKASGRGTVPCGTKSNTMCDANGKLIDIPLNHVSGELPVINTTTENRLALLRTLDLKQGDVAVFVARDEAGKEQTVGVFKYSDAKGELKTRVVPIPIAADKVPKEVRANFVAIMDSLDPPENAPAPPPRASLKPVSDEPLRFRDDPSKLSEWRTRQAPNGDSESFLVYKEKNPNTGDIESKKMSFPGVSDFDAFRKTEEFGKLSPVVQEAISLKVNRDAFANRVTSDNTSPTPSKVKFKDEPNVFHITTKTLSDGSEIPVLRYKMNGEIQKSIPLKADGAISADDFIKLPQDVKRALPEDFKQLIVISFNEDPTNINSKKTMDDMGRVTIVGDSLNKTNKFPVNHIPISNGGLPWTSQENLDIDLKPEVDIAFRLGKEGEMKGMYKDAEGNLKSIALTVSLIDGEERGSLEVIDMPSGDLPKAVKMNLTKAVTEWNKQKEEDFKNGYINISAEPELP